jgi:LysM repeat protein
LASYDYETGREVIARSDLIEETLIEEATPVTLIEDPIVVPAPSNTIVTPPEDKKRSLYATHTVAKGDTL